ncbi:MAG: hypothetical protein ABI425_05620 [Patescibacteria group bacterium]
MSAPQEQLHELPRSNEQDQFDIGVPREDLIPDNEYTRRTQSFPAMGPRPLPDAENQDAIPAIPAEDQISEPKVQATAPLERNVADPKLIVEVSPVVMDQLKNITELEAFITVLLEKVFPDENDGIEYMISLMVLNLTFAEDHPNFSIPQYPELRLPYLADGPVDEEDLNEPRFADQRKVRIINITATLLKLARQPSPPRIHNT